MENKSIEVGDMVKVHVKNYPSEKPDTILEGEVEDLSITEVNYKVKGNWYHKDWLTLISKSTDGGGKKEEWELDTIGGKAGKYAHDWEVQNGFDQHPKTASYCGFIAGYEAALSQLPPQKDMKEKLKEISPDELWDDFSEYVDDNSDSLSRIAGSTIITRSQYLKLMESLMLGKILYNHKSDSDMKPLTAEAQVQILAKAMKEINEKMAALISDEDLTDEKLREYSEADFSNIQQIAVKALFDSATHPSIAF